MKKFGFGIALLLISGFWWLGGFLRVAEWVVGGGWMGGLMVVTRWVWIDLKMNILFK